MINNEIIELEKRRNYLAEKGDLKELKKLYNKSFPEITDENSAGFWNKRLKIHKTLKTVDPMTKDRVSLAAGFIPNNAKRILDIGIGNGWVEELISDTNIELYGSDISDKTIKNIRNKFKGEFSVQSIYNLNYKKNYFDTVLLLEVLEHIPPSKTFLVLKKIKNLLKPDGFLVLSVPMNEGLEKMKDNPNSHLRMYTTPLIFTELKIAGFKILKFQRLYAFGNFYQLKKFLAKFVKRWNANNIIIQAQKTRHH